MLSDYQHSYRRLEQLFQQLQVKITDASITNAALKMDLAEIQQVQRQILSFQPPSTDAEAEDVGSQAVDNFQTRFQPIQTEVAKQLRLLETDLLFLQSARQAATAQQHKQRIDDRLTLLLRYCAAILAL